MSDLDNNNPDTPPVVEPKGNNNDKDNENGQQEEQETSYDGESNAYGDPISISGNKKKKEDDISEDKDKEDDELSAPEHSKAKGDGKANTLMEVFWNDVIMEAYKKCLDVPVDATLDFIDWALFTSHTSKKKKKKAKPGKKDIWDYGDDVVDKYAKSAYLCKELFKKAHEELMENIEKAQAGIKPTWNIWPGKKAPKFFEEFVGYAKKAKEDPNSPEAVKWKRLTALPNTMEVLYNTELLCRSIAVGYATMEVALSKESLTLPPELLKKVKEMDKISATVKNGAQYKKSMELKIREMKNLLKGDAPINKEIRKNLTTIENTLSDPKLKPAEKVKKVNQVLNVIREASPAAAAIDEASQKHYENIRQNVEKIKEKYKDNPKQKHKYISEYIKGLSRGYKETRPIVEKYIKHSLSGRVVAMGVATGAILSEGLKIAGKAIKEENKEIEGTPVAKLHTPDEKNESHDGAPVAGGSQKQGYAPVNLKQTVEERVKKLVANINEFKVENTEIAKLTSPEKVETNPFVSKLGAFAIFKDHSSR
ncbi:MAG: hypothetical protein J6W96_04825 [Alphaproteobacteria bacterium]|nr:hypothetical protein [Alphaproteobacteria bacterium]